MNTDTAFCHRWNWNRFGTEKSDIELLHCTPNCTPVLWKPRILETKRTVRQTDRDKDTNTDRQAHTYLSTDTGKDRDRETDRQRQANTDIDTDRHIGYLPTYRQTETRTPTDRQRQTTTDTFIYVSIEGV